MEVEAEEVRVPAPTSNYIAVLSQPQQRIGVGCRTLADRFVAEKQCKTSFQFLLDAGSTTVLTSVPDQIKAMLFNVEIGGYLDTKSTTHGLFVR